MPTITANTGTKHTLVVLLEDEPGALNRVVSMFRRRSFNIESLSVGHTEEANLSRMTLTVAGEDNEVEQMVKHLYKVLEVVKVTDVTAEQSIIREMALIKVTADKPENRAEIMQFAEIFKARVLDVAPDSITLESTGPEDEVDRLFILLKRYGIKESVRTGSVAMLRGSSVAGAI
ncbi:MAG: acetolactate synthase small subunit [Chloroflexi bacterium]|jgi:acetolactate synthase-1/3 small subunit|uniref:Acetolactate synthase small subunit n=1 Tax=Candidatus Chlorohelix allophototropha TaxID=3003348 RepID=A0A8T7M1M0_9CHLR|nr:acetolactate synthase small subunit [Chloroflexota bacterium]WJW67474.1 acetolactate synthase small subunit [Chloroflexota bacterium L227-S17]